MKSLLCDNFENYTFLCVLYWNVLRESKHTQIIVSRKFGIQFYSNMFRRFRALGSKTKIKISATNKGCLSHRSFWQIVNIFGVYTEHNYLNLQHVSLITTPIVLQYLVSCSSYVNVQETCWRRSKWSLFICALNKTFRYYRSLYSLRLA